MTSCLLALSALQGQQVLQPPRYQSAGALTHAPLSASSLQPLQEEPVPLPLYFLH